MTAIEVLAEDYLRGCVLEPHDHATDQLVFASAGVMRVVTVEGSWVVPPERALIIRAGIMHEVHCRTPVAMRTLYLDLGDAVPGGGGCTVVDVSPLLREVILRLVASNAGGSQQAALLALLASELSRVDVAPLHLPQPRDPRLRRICAALEADAEDASTLEAWAARLGIGRRTLIRRFLGETGMTFRQWRQQLRLLRGLELLADGLPVTAAAIDLGYATTSAFIAAFRDAFGTTPGRYFDRPARRESAAARMMAGPHGMD